MDSTEKQTKTINLGPLLETVNEIAVARFGGNKSLTVRHYILLGLEAERSQPPERPKLEAARHTDVGGGGHH